MAVRIYSLAKELKLDSKDLVERCADAGIHGKGSALASLTDEEEVTLRAFLAGGGRPAPAKRAAPKAAPAPVAPVAAPVAVAVAKAPPPQVAEPAALRREDYVAPGGAGADKGAMLGDLPTSKPARKKPSNGEQSKPVVKAPAVKLAPLPSHTPPVQAKSKEPIAQKPDIKLPMDVIRASKAGSKPLSDHMKKAEQKRDEQQSQTPAARKPGGPGTADAAPNGRCG